MTRDGLVFRSDDHARWQALEALPDMALAKIPDGGFRLFRVPVRDQQGDLVYEATMALTGRWRKGGKAAPGPWSVVVNESS